MLLHQNNHFIFDRRVAIKLPDNVFLDPNPDPCPAEGMVLYTEDFRTRININFIVVNQDIKSFLEDGTENHPSAEYIAPIRDIESNGLLSSTATYAFHNEICEEYVFAIPGNIPALLDVCFEQKKGDPSNEAEYTRVRDELIAGIKYLPN